MWKEKNPEITYVPQQDCVSGFPFRFPTVFPTQEPVPCTCDPSPTGLTTGIKRRLFCVLNSPGYNSRIIRSNWSLRVHRLQRHILWNGLILLRMLWYVWWVPVTVKFTQEKYPNNNTKQRKYFESILKKKTQNALALMSS